MKILAIGSHILKEANKQSQVDHWRIGRPLEELAKHVDWQIDYSPTFIVGYDKYKNKDEFTEEEMERAFMRLKNYDIVFASYHPDPTAYTMLKVARDRHGTQFVMDCDDDMFAINPDNPFWMKMTDEKVYWMQRMIADNDWITTPSEELAKRFRERRPGLHKDTVRVIPNYIADVYKHPGFDNSPNIVIGYMGGSSHFADLHESGALPAIRKIMHDNKNVRFKSVGMLVDQYIPKSRFEFDGGQRGTDFLNNVYPNLKMDIAIGPLLDNQFNKGKSNIKWQEMTRAGSAFVASRVGPYSKLQSGKTCLLVNNTEEEWYKALKKLVDDKDKRKELVKNAQEELSKNWRLENHWQAYQYFFKKVKDTARFSTLSKQGFII